MSYGVTAMRNAQIKARRGLLRGYGVTTPLQMRAGVCAWACVRMHACMRDPS
jgi:hypothetical protein